MLNSLIPQVDALNSWDHSILLRPSGPNMECPKVSKINPKDPHTSRVIAENPLKKLKCPYITKESPWRVLTTWRCVSLRTSLLYEPLKCFPLWTNMICKIYLLARWTHLLNLQCSIVTVSWEDLDRTPAQ